MRADTHDGPEQMLHVKGLIHCCSSHVRRSRNSVLQRTAGPYILARSRPIQAGAGLPLSKDQRTCTRPPGMTDSDPSETLAAHRRRAADDGFSPINVLVLAAVC